MPRPYGSLLPGSHPPRIESGHSGWSTRGRQSDAKPDTEQGVFKPFPEEKSTRDKNYGHQVGRGATSN